MEYYGHARNSVYGHTISAVGELEGVEAEDYREGKHLRGGERGVWKYCWRGGSRCDDAVGCAEDKDDAGEGEASCGAVVGPDIEGLWAQSFLCWDGAEGAVDLGWWSDLSR